MFSTYFINLCFQVGNTGVRPVVADELPTAAVSRHGQPSCFCTKVIHEVNPPGTGAGAGVGVVAGAVAGAVDNA